MNRGIPYQKARDEMFKKRPNVKRVYDSMEAEYALIERMIEKRLNHEMTQEELAKKLGTKQSAISRFEAGGSNPTMAFLYKLARALDAKLKITVT